MTNRPDTPTSVTNIDDSTRFPWANAPSAKEKNQVQRAVTALLDALAPEPALPRGSRIVARIEHHRTPEGCVLQGASAAISVSWFAESTAASPLGELHVVVWRGVVSRRGAPPRREGASVGSTLVLHPVEQTAAGCSWRNGQGVKYDTVALADHCLALLEEELSR